MKGLRAKLAFPDLRGSQLSYETVDMVTAGLGTEAYQRRDIVYSVLHLEVDDPLILGLLVLDEAGNSGVLQDLQGRVGTDIVDIRFRIDGRMGS